MSVPVGNVRSFVEKHFGLHEKVAVVTGGGQGVGEILSKALNSAGATVVVTGRRQEPLRKMMEVLVEHDRENGWRQCDVTSENDVADLMRWVKERYGRLDILINNAGISSVANAENMELSAWESVLKTNLTGTFLCAKAAATIMIEQKFGRIVNVASQYAVVASTAVNQAGYCASKGGVVNLTKALAVEWAKYGITVNAIAPGFVKTEQTEWAFKDPELRNVLLSRVPMGRMVNPEELEGAIIFLCASTSSFVTGHTLFVDGGWVSW